MAPPGRRWWRASAAGTVSRGELTDGRQGGQACASGSAHRHVPAAVARPCQPPPPPLRPPPLPLLTPLSHSPPSPLLFHLPPHLLFRPPTLPRPSPLEQGQGLAGSFADVRGLDVAAGSPGVFGAASAAHIATHGHTLGRREGRREEERKRRGHETHKRKIRQSTCTHFSYEHFSLWRIVHSSLLSLSRVSLALRSYTPLNAVLRLATRYPFTLYPFTF